MCRTSPKPRVVTKRVFAPRRVIRALVPRVVPSRTTHGGMGSSRGNPRNRRIASSGASSGETSFERMTDNWRCCQWTGKPETEELTVGLRYLLLAYDLAPLVKQPQLETPPKTARLLSHATCEYPSPRGPNLNGTLDEGAGQDLLSPDRPIRPPCQAVGERPADIEPELPAVVAHDRPACELLPAADAVQMPHRPHVHLPAGNRRRRAAFALELGLAQFLVGAISRQTDDEPRVIDAEDLVPSTNRRAVVGPPGRPRSFHNSLPVDASTQRTTPASDQRRSGHPWRLASARSSPRPDLVYHLRILSRFAGNHVIAAAAGTGGAEDEAAGHHRRS